MGLGTRRTGPVQDVWGTRAIPLQSPAVLDYTDAFVPKGQCVNLFGDFAGAVGDLMITLQCLSSDGVTWQDVGGPRHVWTRNIPGAMSGIMPISGYPFITEESYRFAVICEIGGVMMHLGIICTDHEVTECLTPILEELLTVTSSETETELVDVASLTDGGGGYPFTGYLPDAAGTVIAGENDVVVDFLITGGVGVGDDITLTIEVQDIDGADWRDWTTAGANSLNSMMRGAAAFTSIGTGAAVEACLHYDNINAYAVRVVYLLGDASGPCEINLRTKRVTA